MRWYSNSSVRKWLIATLAIYQWLQPIGRLDRWVLEHSRDPLQQSLPWGPDWLRELGRDVSGLGGVGWLTTLTVVATAYLVTLGLRRRAAWLLLTVLGALTISSALKHTIARPRPEIGGFQSYVQTHSFPSGHSLMSAVVYGAIGCLIIQQLDRWSRGTATAPSQRRYTITRRWVIAGAIGLPLLIGLSRVYLGVHYPSDVLGGWSIAAGWLWVRRRSPWLTGGE